MTPDGRKTVTINEACQRVGVSRRTIYTWMAKGKIESVRTAGGTVRIYEYSLWQDPDQPPPEPRRIGAVAARSNA